MKLLYPLIILFAFSFAEEKTFIREYTYQASDYDSKVTSRANSLEQVKRILLEEVSVFIKSEVDWTQTEQLIKGKYELTDFYENKIQTVTAGITETVILDEKWTGVEYWIKAEITIDPDDIKRRVDEIIQNKKKLKELDDVRKKADDALAEIERLKKELANSESEVEQLRLSKEYNKQTDVLTAADWFTKAYNAAINKEYDKSISFSLRAIELSPEADTYYNLGNTYGNLGQHNKAIKNYQKAIELNPEITPLAYFNMGTSYALLGENDKAIKNYQKTIELNPKYALAYHNLGYIYDDLGQYDKAKKNYEKSIKLDPEYAAAYYNMGLSYVNKGQYDKAIEYFKKTLKLKPNDADAYYNMGLSYNDLGQYDKAIDVLKKAARLGQQDAQNVLKENGYEW